MHPQIAIEEQTYRDEISRQIATCGRAAEANLPHFARHRFEISGLLEEYEMMSNLGKGK